MENQLKGLERVTRVEGVDGTRKHPVARSGVHQVNGCFTQSDGKSSSSSSLHNPPIVTFRSTYSLKSSQFGCTLSHLKALTQIERDGHDWALVCEDDAALTLSGKWPTDILATLRAKGEAVGAGIVQLYWAPRSETPSSKYHKFSTYQLVPMFAAPCWGTVAYLVSKKGIQDILGYTGRFPLDGPTLDTETVLHADADQRGQMELLYIDDPCKSPRHTAQYRHLQRQELAGVADSFLYGLTPTYTCGRPLVLFDNCDMDAIVSATNRPRSLSIQEKIMTLYA